MLSNPDFSPEFVKMHEKSVVLQLGLDAYETDLVRAGVEDLRDLWRRNQQETARVASRRRDLNPAELTALMGLSAQLDAAITEQAARIMRSVRPEVSVRAHALSFVPDRAPAVRESKR